jgi:hypothetical protein
MRDNFPLPAFGNRAAQTILRTPFDPGFWRIKPLSGLGSFNESKILQIQLKKMRNLPLPSVRSKHVLGGLSLPNQ